MAPLKVIEPSGAFRCDPHPRTLRKAREQIKVLVNDEASPSRIRTYWLCFLRWWTNTCPSWSVESFVSEFFERCWDPRDHCDREIHSKGSYRFTGRGISVGCRLVSWQSTESLLKKCRTARRRTRNPARLHPRAALAAAPQ